MCRLVYLILSDIFNTTFISQFIYISPRFPIICMGDNNIKLVNITLKPFG